MPRADRPLSGKIRRLSSRPGAAAVAPSKCASPLSSLRRKVFILRQQRLAAQLLHLRGANECVRQRVPVSMPQTHQFHRVGTAKFLISALARRELVRRKCRRFCFERRSFVGVHDTTANKGLRFREASVNSLQRRSEHDMSYVSTETCPSMPALHR